MDEFLNDIQTSLFKEWLLLQKKPGFEVFLDAHNTHMVIIKTAYSYSEVIFHPMNIIELSVKNTFNNKVEFYLHFQMKNLKHAFELYDEMLESIHTLIHHPTIKILLSCSGGMTTAFFAEKIKAVAEHHYPHFEFAAAAYTDLFDKSSDYDIVMLAPQISYLHAKVQDILKQQTIIKIPPQVFARYDANKILEIICQTLENKKNNVLQPLPPLTFSSEIRHKSQILALSIFRNSHRVHVAYRVYSENNQILLDNEIIKKDLTIDNIYDVLDTLFVTYPQLSTIGISIPGIINHGFVTSTNIQGFDSIYLQKLLTARYHKTFLISNDVNMAASGYYASQELYSSLSFLFQPTNYHAGVGTIIHGHLIEGHLHLAGEIQYLPLQLSDDKLILSKTPEGALELVSKTILSLMSIVSPEAIILSCVLIPEVNELQKELEAYIPKAYIPTLIKVENIQDYILHGLTLLCSQTLIS